MASTVITRSAIVAYSDREMYDLVADIANYPAFLPWCSSAHVDSQTSEYVVATVGIQFSGIKKSFTTRNVLNPYDEIGLSLVKGPFSQLDGSWAFKKLDDQACEVTLTLAFDFKSAVLRAVVGPVFGHIANTMVDAFHGRARDVYGERLG